MPKTSKTELAKKQEEILTAKVDEQLSQMMSVFWDPNMMQLRLEQWGWGNEILIDTMKETIKSYNEVMKMDPDMVAENPDQYIKMLQLKINAGKKFMQFLWGKDTKDPISVPEVTPLMWRAENKW